MYDVRRRHEGSAVGPIVHYAYPTYSYRDYPIRHDETMLRNETKLNKQTRERERERERMFAINKMKVYVSK